jgi:trk system potassium uptake protein TrkH
MPTVQDLPKLARRVPLPWRLILGLVGLAVFGMLILMATGALGGKPLDWNIALFLSVSALTCTGLSPIPLGGELSLGSQWALVALVQVGGVGYMTLAILTLRLIGRRITLADRLALQDALGVVSVRGVFSLAKLIFLWMLVVQVIGALLLRSAWSGRVPEADLTLFAVFHAVSSFCNAGFDIFSGHPRVTIPIPNDAATLAIKGTLIFLGGLGLPVIFELLNRIVRRQRTSLHVKLTLATLLTLTTLGTIAIFAVERSAGGTLEAFSAGRQWELALYQANAARSAGFAGLPAFETLKPATQLVIMCLMFIGSAPASTGGGITTGTFIVLLLAVVAYVRGHSTPRVAGRAIPGTMVRKASSILVISLGLVVSATFALTVSHDVTIDRAVFEVISAFATCGLTLAFTDKLSVFGQLVICAVMAWGRLGALTILFALTRNDRVERVQYPEERILIG